MALKLEDKKAIVAEVNEAAGSALSAVVANYRGMDVGALTEMRDKAREGKVYLRVVRNTLAKRAVVGTEFECLTDALVGPSLIGFSHEEPSAAANLLAGHAVHCATFDAVEYLPTAHAVHVVPPVLVPASVIEPAAQSVHVESVEFVEYLPAAHSSHVVAPALVPVLVIEPARHALQ